jgi:hypothetical protein
MDNQGSVVGRGRDFFLFITATRPALGSTHSPVQLVLRALAVGVKQLGYEADHLSPSSAEVELYLYFITCLRVVMFN